MKQKTNWMLLLIIGIISSAVTSCDKGDVDYIYFEIYTYSNNSDHSIKIDQWKNGNSTVFDLAQSGEIEFKLELGINSSCSVDGIATLNANECLLITSDLIKITFDDNKFLLFRPEDNRDINILNDGNYNYSKAGNKKYYTYDFSERDYQEAQ